MRFFVGQKAQFSKTLSEYDLYGFAGISGDFNPVHIDAVTAKQSMFSGQICHGLLVASYISAVLGMKMPGPGTIYLNQTLSFKKPVYLGDTITAEAEIIEIKEKNRF